MPRDVESVHSFVQDPRFGLAKQKTVIRCDDGTVYEFEDVEGRPDSEPPRLIRGFQPDGTVTHERRANVLPSAVEETVETLFGGWSK